MQLYLKRLARLLTEKRLTISTAESCTGGLLSKYLTDIPGSSAYFTGGLVTYSNESKIKLLGVKEKTLEKYGAVSEHTAREMAAGVKRLFGTDIAVSITGIAGPDGGSKGKPVGTVYLGLLVKNKLFLYKKFFEGNRKEVREKSTEFIIREIIKKCGG